MTLKTYLTFLLVGGLFLFTACEEEGINPRFVPAELKDDLNARHPDAKGVEWELEGDVWEVEFVENGVDIGIIYDLDFTWIRTAWGISIDELPTGAMEYIDTNFPGGVIEEAEIFESSNEGDGYIAEVIFGKFEHEIFFDRDGNYLREEIEEDDGD